MKYFFIFALSLSFVALAPHAFAQFVSPGGACTQDSDCQDANGQSYGCFPEGNGICTVDGDAAADGTVPPGGACTNDTSCEDVGGQSYGCYQGTCTLNGDAPTSGAVPGNLNGSGTAPGTAAPSTGSVSLLNPLKSGTSLPTLVSEILGFVTQIGTVIIILMVVYCGFLFVMAQGDPSKLTQARQALMWTVVGALILLGAQAIATAIQATATAL